MKLAFPAILWLLLGAADCAASVPEQNGPVAAPVPAPSDQQQLKELTGRVDRLEKHLSLLACGPQLKHLLDNIRYECQAQASASANAASDEADTSCGSAQIEPAVVSAERQSDKKFIKLMTVLPHAVVFLGEGVTSIPTRRTEQLQALIEDTPLLGLTRFLLVTSPLRGKAEASRRAKLLSDWLDAYLTAHKSDAKKDGKVEGKIDVPWLYNFSLNPKDLSPADKFIPTESKDLARGIWVFRTDC